MALAALLHVAIPLIWLLHWPAPAPLVLPRPIPVALVMAPPSKAPPTPPPPPPAPKEAPAAHYLESGPGEHTTALAPAEAVAPERASPPEPEAPTSAPIPQPAETAAAGETPSAKPASAATEVSKAKAKPRKEIARLEHTPKEALKPQAPSLTPPPRHLNIQLGDKNESGDPYLNHLMALIEAHRVYPRITGQFGLLVEGAPVYGLILNRAGSIVRLGLIRSSGNANLDQVGATMIEQSAPLPPLPAYIPDGGMIVLTLPLYPQS